MPIWLRSGTGRCPYATTSPRTRPLLLDHGFAHQTADERVAVRFLVARAGDRHVREALHRTEQLRAGQRLSSGGLGRTLLREVGGALREMLAFAMTGQTDNSTPSGPNARNAIPGPGQPRPRPTARCSPCRSSSGSRH